MENNEECNIALQGYDIHLNNDSHGLSKTNQSTFKRFSMNYVRLAEKVAEVYVSAKGYTDCLYIAI